MYIYSHLQYRYYTSALFSWIIARLQNSFLIPKQVKFKNRSRSNFKMLEPGSDVNKCILQRQSIHIAFYTLLPLL